MGRTLSSEQRDQKLATLLRSQMVDRALSRLQRIQKISKLLRNQMVDYLKGMVDGSGLTNHSNSGYVSNMVMRPDQNCRLNG